MVDSNSRSEPYGANAQGRDYFNRQHWLTRPQIWVSLRQRARLYDHWRREVGSPAGLRVLDFGTTPDVFRQDSNCFVQWLLRDGASVSLASIEDISNLQSEFPDARLLPRIQPGQPIAAGPGEFDWVFSSAVLEHVGDFDAQLHHLRECGRVAHSIFLTTPAREHWLEFHTKLPFLHWLPRRYHRAILRRLGHEDWSREDWLRLVSASELKQQARLALGATHRFELRRFRALGMVSNLLLIARLK